MLVRGKFIINNFRDDEKPYLVMVLSILIFILFSYLLSVLDNLIIQNIKYRVAIEKNFQSQNILKVTGLEELNSSFHKYISWSVADWDDIWSSVESDENAFSSSLVRSANTSLQTTLASIFDVTKAKKCNKDFIDNRLEPEGNTKDIFQHLSFHTLLAEGTVRTPNELNSQECTDLGWKNWSGVRERIWLNS